MKRRVPLVRKPSKFVLSPPDTAILDWVKANGIDPSTVLDGQMALIEDGMLTLQTIVKDADGHMILEPNGSPVIQTSSYTLTAPPEDFDLRILG